jgi:hypothetical protein
MGSLAFPFLTFPPPLGVGECGNVNAAPGDPCVGMCARWGRGGIEIPMTFPRWGRAVVLVVAGACWFALSSHDQEHEETARVIDSPRGLAAGL